MKNKALLAICVLAFLASACAGFNQTGINGDGSAEVVKIQNANSNLVASNLIFALTQLEETRPINTTVQISEPVTPLGDTVLRLLRESGYGIQKVDGDLGANYVRYKYEESTTERGPVTRYTMSIGEIEASRNYTMQDKNIYPDSALEITGAEETFVQLNDGIFSGSGSNYEEMVFFNDTVLPEISEEEAQTVVTNTGMPLQSLFKKNIFDTRASNFASIYVQYDNIASEILEFSNDSMALGEKNKRIIAKFAESMDPETDLISVIGCSHGNTKIKNGNNVLAIGRANRVKEEFIYAGVDYGKVFDEGCWDDEYFDEVMPRRGVVMTLKRLKPAG